VYSSWELKNKIMKKIRKEEITGKEDATKVYILEPNFNQDFYSQRVDRNIGWITKDEQNILRESTVGIAGVGGMGGLIASNLLRLGVGTLKIADTEEFDISNINRQFGARKSTVGKSKALVTGRLLHEISDDIQILIYPMGITEETSINFSKGCDLVCDEIEFWALASRMLLHKNCRELDVPILSCNTVGHQTNLMYFNQCSESIEKSFGVNLDEAFSIQKRIQSNSSLEKEVLDTLERISKVLVPSEPDYNSVNNGLTLRGAVLERLKKERKASIIATNPSFAAGFISNHVLFQLLKKSSTKREVVLPPLFPGYLSFDAGLMTASRVIR